MKKCIHLAIVFSCLLMQVTIFANTVIVKGYIKDAGNKAVANKNVRIYTDSSDQSCKVSHTVITNPNGYYIDTLSCNGVISKLKIAVENCNGILLINDPLVSTASNVVESNFIICTPDSNPPVNCKAAFTYTSAATGTGFSSAGAQVPDGDSIITRMWIFGDSSEVVSGNIISPVHIYKKPGSYNVCLYIKTKKGCESRYCAVVAFTSVIPECKVELKLSSEKIAPKKFHFFSNLSETIAGDSIISRTWKFGDGSSLDGNQVSPVKEYRDTGTFTVCLQVKTAKGCEKSSCFTLGVHDTVPLPAPATCSAHFTYTLKDSIAFFNSAGSGAAFAGDSIISRTWYFVDSAKGPNAVILLGNKIDPTYIFSKPGVYPVYLLIKTKKGCESKFAAYVTVPPIIRECQAELHVNIEKSNAASRNVRFMSNTTTVSAGDSIIHRSWKFGDNTSLEGNEVYVLKEYKDTGVYNVCFSIRTARGCEKSYCFTVGIHDTIAAVPTRNCKATFTNSSPTQAVGTLAGIIFNSAGSTAPAGDSIISRSWTFGDSTESIGGNRVDPSHAFVKAGTYNVCLVIKTKKGCENKFCSTVIIRPLITVCKAYFTSVVKDSVVSFNSEGSVASSPGDSIISRTWYYKDDTTSVSVSGNDVHPSYTYTKPGTYIVYLVIKTRSGCESKYSGTVTIAARPVPTNCHAIFTYTIQNTGTGVRFNSSQSTATSADDSIISRIWMFGDTTQLSGNAIDLVHTYLKVGTYHVYLYIKTIKGCESKYESTVTLLPVPVKCATTVLFSAERLGSKKIQFNSNLSVVQAGDSIVEHRWKFGDGSGLSGNVSNPLKEFNVQGVYNTCLQVKTAKGCETQFCKQVVVQDSSLGFPGSSVDYVHIVTINPNPVITRMLATIWSRNKNVEVDISIYDIYGTTKMTLKKLLSEGNNIIEIATSALYHGPYFLRVSSRGGKDSKAFYKL